MLTMESPREAQTTENLLETGLAAVEQRMLHITHSEVDVLQQASRHILQAGGKRIRPRLALLSYLATGGQEVESVIDAAAAVELVHTASVVHDDINDHGVVRRGRPSVNALWGRTFALLTGDFLFTKVYELMSPYRDHNITLAEATVALVEGETLQASAVKNNNFTREIYYRIIALKTAALFKSAAVIGAQLAAAPTKQVEALGQFAFNVGLAFQIVDDILDIVGDEQKLGKTAGIDIAQGRGLASVQEDKPADMVESLKHKILSGDAIEKGREQANLLIHQAIALLDVLPDTPYRDELIDLAYLVVNREF